MTKLLAAAKGGPVTESTPSDVGRALVAMRKTRELRCALCGARFESNAPNAKHCGPNCTAKAYRRRKTEQERLEAKARAQNDPTE